MTMLVSRVTEQKSKNMMGPDNLAIVFAPTLMRSPDANPLVSLMYAQYEQRCVEIIITNYREIFSRMSTVSTVVALDNNRTADRGPIVDHV